MTPYGAQKDRAVGKVCHSLLIILAINLLSLTTLLSADPEALHEDAIKLSRQGEHEKALESLEKAYSIFSQDLVLKKNLAVEHVIVGKDLMTKNSFDEAAGHFLAARELFPEEGALWALRGVALYAGKDFDAALYELDQARQLGHDTADVLYYIGRIFYDRGGTADGVEAWEKGLAKNPDSQLLKDALAKARREADVEQKMERGESGRFTLLYDAEVKTDIADKVLDALEESYNAVGSDLSWFPSQRVPVLLYTRKNFAAVTTSPDWSGGLYDGKIRLPVGGVETIDARFAAVLRHEYTHAVVHEIAHGNAPVWLNEGLAEIEGRSLLKPAVETGLLGRHLLPITSLEGPFTSMSRQEALLAYEESYSFVSFLISMYGWHKVREILVNLGENRSVEDAVGRALAQYGATYADAISLWSYKLNKE